MAECAPKPLDVALPQGHSGSKEVGTHGGQRSAAASITKMSATETTAMFQFFVSDPFTASLLVLVLLLQLGC